MDDKAFVKLVDKIAATTERQFAEVLDDLAQLIESEELSYHEASWALRTMAGGLRTIADKREVSA